MQKNLLTIEEGKKGGAILDREICFSSKTVKANNIVENIPIDETIKFEDISISFGHQEGTTKKRIIFRNANLKINRGDFVGIIGPSGHGKTTLLEVIAGVRKPNSGRVMVDERNLENHQRAWLGIGYLSQNALVLDGGIRDNIAFGFKKNHIHKNQNTALINKWGSHI